MKVSIGLHREMPSEDGNQRQNEIWYGGYNRQLADMQIDPETGNGICIINEMSFPPVLTDPEHARYLSFAEAHAPDGYGGKIIIAGPFEGGGFMMLQGEAPFVKQFAAGVYAEKLKKLGCIKQVDDKWVELSEEELRARPLSLFQ